MATLPKRIIKVSLSFAFIIQSCDGYDDNKWQYFLQKTHKSTNYYIIIQETERLVSDPVPGITAIPHEENLRYFDVTIQGPDQSPYEGGVFKLELFLPDDYPSEYHGEQRYRCYIKQNVERDRD